MFARTRQRNITAVACTTDVGTRVQAGTCTDTDADIARIATGHVIIGGGQATRGKSSLRIAAA